MYVSWRPHPLPIDPLRFADGKIGEEGGGAWEYTSEDRVGRGRKDVWDDTHDPIQLALRLPPPLYCGSEGEKSLLEPHPRLTLRPLLPSPPRCLDVKLHISRDKERNADLHTLGLR